MADSFTLSEAAQVTGIEFVTWLISGDALQSVDWSIVSSPYPLGTIYASGTSSPATTFIEVNPLGAVIWNNIIGTSFNLPAGSYWLMLQNAVATNVETNTDPAPAFWDLNDGPSQAWDSSNGYFTSGSCAGYDGGYGGTCSETFQIYGNVSSATPLPSTWTMMLIGLVGLAFVGYSQRKKGTVPAAA